MTLQDLATLARDRLRSPQGGGRPTGVGWDVRRLVAMSPGTLGGLRALSAALAEREGIRVEPLQVAALILETALRASDD